ncbi:hypothetical protein C6P40_004157 [Pichia californica]|uniref:Homing endonuclease LAGLIDADG domain-containing protein n=1 Tax=Pichia californica TaxID=460514 RepID=A0A9P6WHX9_9ASCO|nr:hypothetical protein C6P42_003853 [[Candida] californica]KAG0686422.1 hypothetical protein C6P40_004157 [[Candida] californica]
MLNNKDLLIKIDNFLNKIDYTEFIKKQLKELLLRYEFCRINNSSHYNYKLEVINIKKFNDHLIGFIDGDGSLRSGKRVGHKKGLYRFVPNISIKLDGIDLNYLQLVVNKLDLTNKEVYNTLDIKPKAVINISSKEDFEKVMNLIEENGGFLSQKRVRDFKLLKKLLVYLNETQLNVHNIT